jgi:hypothetical protein|tara:strand:+ start:282 stop:587 length:306 start_codon:yes stop_codon:yes gene_type:complete
MLARNGKENTMSLNWSEDQAKEIMSEYSDLVFHGSVPHLNPTQQALLIPLIANALCAERERAAKIVEVASSAARFGWTAMAVKLDFIAQQIRRKDNRWSYS